MILGHDLAADIRYNFPYYPIKVVFDVGAHFGETTVEFARWFYGAKIYCFEPASKSYECLITEVTKISECGVYCHRLALGAARGDKLLHVHPDPEKSTLNSLIYCQPGSTVCQVRIETIDEFCVDHDIRAIDLLKIDAEGSDLDVLRGADSMLSRGAITFILVEACLQSCERPFIPIYHFTNLLKSWEYEVFAIYDQRHYLSGRKSLSYFNTAFVHGKLLV